MKRRSKRPTPLMLFWSKKDQKRFIDAVESFIATANDLQTLTLELRELLVVVRARRRPKPSPADDVGNERVNLAEIAELGATP